MLSHVIIDGQFVFKAIYDYHTLWMKARRAVYEFTEASQEAGTVHSECSPSSVSLRESVAKVCTNKAGKKLSEVFEAHCVDSWVMAADALGLLRGPLNRNILCVAPLNFRRRSLHLQVPAKNGKRRIHGGTRSAGHRKGALVISTKYGLTYLGGSNQNRVSLHDLKDGNRLTNSADLTTCKVLGYNSVRFHWAKDSTAVNRTVIAPKAIQTDGLEDTVNQTATS